jgi:hypothetical protein
MKIIINNTDYLANFLALKSKLPKIQDLDIINSIESVLVLEKSVRFNFRSTPIYFEELNKLSEILNLYTLVYIEKNEVGYRLNEVLEK